jgi:hypothetical protein
MLGMLVNDVVTQNDVVVGADVETALVVGCTDDDDELEWEALEEDEAGVECDALAEAECDSLAAEDAAVVVVECDAVEETDLDGEVDGEVDDGVDGEVDADEAEAGAEDEE